MSIETKIIRTFAFAFAGVFLPGLANILFDVSKTFDYSTGKTALMSLLFAAASAAVRAVVAFLPVFKDDTVGIQKT